MLKTTKSLLAGALLLAGAAVGAQAAFKDPLDVPAQPSVRITSSLLFAVAPAGEQRLVAAGERGRMLVSTDRGASWKQSSVPVSTDLVAISFPTDQQGWAVGHGGVILHSADGGQTWQRQLDGRQIAAMSLAYYEKRMPTTDPALSRAFDEAKRYAEEGATQPLLDVWFESAEVGYAIGTFNTMLKTVDGGQTWIPWSEHVDNPRSLHLHAMRQFGGDVYVAGEQGLLLKLDRRQERFVHLDSGYEGSFFGLAGNDQFVVAYGLRGSAYRSTDHGLTWTRLTTNVGASITAGTVLADGRLVLGTANGSLLISRDGGNTFEQAANAANLPVFSMAAQGTHVAVVGPAGVHIESLK
ncbi:WD40/YVTN/BNR-like repeat-containing protein [Herbaspirillum rubrisubalbicans]|uniref:WD40/YVTN/BNR-like repeat-containing protein n=1 Tax=Herbaspirillum rubrisubalbicans TaxID=80842 RepID=UPI0021AC9CD6|nr:YCF48-related protein [Herbaspirillum rubrisubalbicans]